MSIHSRLLNNKSHYHLMLVVWIVRIGSLTLLLLTLIEFLANVVRYYINLDCSNNIYYP